ncbi:MAG: DUF3857 domain-containing protein [Saprospiraceae bacterium]|nr:DUF3857 domain-containing protein [Saprospiraceae bacterium]
MNIKLCLFVITALIFSNLSAQKFKYGKVTADLLKLTKCEIDSQAHAMVTYKSGKSEVLYFESDGFNLVHNFKKQIKIFNNDVKGIGDIEIFFYSPKSGSGKVKLRAFKGKTYNLTDGKIIETKVNDDNIFETQFNNYTKRVTVAMPNLQKNCVFEYEYELISDYYSNINDWEIQEIFPVLYNEFNIQTPEYYKYQINIVGGVVPLKDNQNKSGRTINYKVTYDNGLAGRKSEYETFNIPYDERTVIFENILPYKIEPFCVNPNDVGGKISHQLVSIQWPNKPVKIIATNYESFNKELLESVSFGKKVKKITM